MVWGLVRIQKLLLQGGTGGLPVHDSMLLFWLSDAAQQAVSGNAVHFIRLCAA